MAARRKPDPEPPPRELTRLEAAHARFEAADQAVDRARANIVEAQRRLDEAEGMLTTANASATAASFAVLQDPDAEGLLDDAVLQATAAERRRDLLAKNTVPAARAALEPRREEREAARQDLLAEQLREAVRLELVPAERDLVAALSAASPALARAEAVRASLRSRFGQVALAPLSLAVPTAIAALCRPTITSHSTPYQIREPTISHAVTGGDIIAKHLLAFGLEPEDVA